MVIINLFQQPESPLKLELQNVNVIIDGNDIGRGTLFISEQTLCWQKDGQFGFSLNYHNVALHAISNDPEVNDKECIYIHTDPRFALTNSNENNVAPINQIDENLDSDEASDSEADLSVLILVPDQPNHVQPIYDAIKTCQMLNPDPADMSDDMEYGFQSVEEADEQMIDNDMNGLVQRLENNSVHQPDDSANEDEFEDAD